MTTTQRDLIKRYLTAIELIAGNLPDSELESKTGPNDAIARGLMVIQARELAKEALQIIS